MTVQPAIGWLAEVLRWCDHWLKRRDTGIMNELMLRVWMQDHVPPKTCYHDRPGRWVAGAEWPSPRIEARRLPLRDRGQLGHASKGTASLCSPLWVGLAAGEVGRYGDAAEWATDQRKDDDGSRVFVTEPLTEPLQILGAPQLHLRFASDKPRVLVSVRLNDVAPDGASTRVSVGHLNLTHRHGHDRPMALTPGQIESVTVDLDDIADAFRAGHHIAVSLSTVYWPITLPSPELATVTRHLGDVPLNCPSARRTPPTPPCAPSTPPT